jgi:hypothetical protein
LSDSEWHLFSRVQITFEFKKKIEYI